MRIYKGEWILTDKEVEQNEQLVRSIKRLLKVLLCGYDSVPKYIEAKGLAVARVERILRKIERT